MHKRVLGETFGRYRDRLARAGRALKLKLRGTFIERGHTWSPAPRIHTEKEFTDAYRRKRKRKNKIAYKSRRRNRVGW